MSDIVAVLFANEAFYQALANKDSEAMDEIWWKGGLVTCLHPGWGPLIGREAVMRSWEAIHRNPRPTDIQCLDPHAYISGDTARVICYELIEDTYLIATNLFVKSGRVWKMTHHQAGPTSARPQTGPPEDEEPVN